MSWRRFLGLGGDLRWDPSPFIRGRTVDLDITCGGIVTPNSESPRPFSGGHQFQGRAFVVETDLILVPAYLDVATYALLSFSKHWTDVLVIDIRTAGFELRDNGTIEFQSGPDNIRLEFGRAWSNVRSTSRLVYETLVAARNLERSDESDGTTYVDSANVVPVVSPSKQVAGRRWLILLGVLLPVWATGYAVAGVPGWLVLITGVAWAASAITGYWFIRSVSGD